MTEPVRVSGLVGHPDRPLTFEAGQLARLADGSVLARMGDTTILATAVASRGVREGIDFFPLTVDVEERMYAAGKIPGSFFRREGRPSEQAVLTCRLIDRPLRPSFPAGFRNEVQVIATILGADLENPHDVPAINAASAALWISGIPFQGPIGAVRLAHRDGAWLAHPTYQEGDTSTFELVVAGRRTESGDVAIMMVEAGGTEATWDLYEAGAPKVTEELILQGLEEAKAAIAASVDLQLALRDAYVERFGPIEPVPYERILDYPDELAEKLAEACWEEVGEALQIGDKAARNARLDEIEVAVAGRLAESTGAVTDEDIRRRREAIRRAYRALQKRLVRARIVTEGARIDGRGPTDLRPISSVVGLIPTAHGSGLFERGETQVLTVSTLGMPRMEQMLDTIGIDESKRYMHHYNFLPFSTGETGRVGSPRRREIGHGALAERALLPVIPPSSEFPYTLRLVSDVLSSNGSTSMASVCGSTLSLMDAGVPIKTPIAGIAMGLIFAEGKFTTLTDILGAEDAFGDMDFKVAGSADFVTALQLDTKLDGLPSDVLGQALLQARAARLAILEVMTAAIPAPRTEVSNQAPKIVSFTIPIDRVGEVIGPKGKVINSIQQETGADVNVDNDGPIATVTIGGRDGAAVAEARRMVELILNPPEAQVGATYTGKVVNITKFGAFVNILPGRDGLLHISKLGGGKRVERVEDVLSLGEEVAVHVDDVDPAGKVSLTLVLPDGGDGEGPDTPSPRPSFSGPSASSGSSGSSGPSGPPIESPASEGVGADRDLVRFEEAWDETAQTEFGELGPGEGEAAAGARRRPPAGSGRRRPPRGGGRR